MARRSTLASRFADFVSPWREAEIRKHVEKKIPLRPEGEKLAVDYAAVDGLLDQAFRAHPPLLHRLKNLFAKACGGEARDYEPLPETRRALRRALMRDFRRAAEPLAFNARELARKNHASRQRILMTPPDQLT